MSFANISASNRWENESLLLSQLLTLLEINKRWRAGIFGPTSSNAFPRDRYFSEIAFALFSNHQVYHDAFAKKPGMFTAAVKSKLERCVCLQWGTFRQILTCLPVFQQGFELGRQSSLTIIPWFGNVRQVDVPSDMY